MFLILLSLISGFLTILAPCALPMLPIIVGGSLKKDVNPKKRAIIIVTSLGVSIFIFTLLIKFSSLLLGLDPQIWAKISGLIIIVLGLFNLFPNLWTSISLKLNLVGKAEGNLSKNYQRKSFFEPVLTGFALGPVFSSCSPTYLFIVSVLLPKSLFVGLTNLLVYCFGLGLVLILVSLGGQKVISKLRWASNPNSVFRKVIAVLFIITGLLIFTGFDKKLEAAILKKNNLLGKYLQIEQELIPQN